MNHIVLFEPEIPQNTGNIMRTCVATNTKLHLIKPFGFVLDDAHLKRSGVNYIDKLKYEVYENFQDFKDKNPGIYYYFTRYGHKPHTSFNYENPNHEQLYFIFGKESTGIPKSILQKDLEDSLEREFSFFVELLLDSPGSLIYIFFILKKINLYIQI